MAKRLPHAFELPKSDIIRSWNTRAYAYDNIVSRWPIFTQMADRLIDLVQADFNGHTLDIGGGSGLVAERFLERHPNARVTLIEPAQEMRRLAQLRLGDRIHIRDATIDEIEGLGFFADAAICNASFHLMNEQTTLPAIAAVLKSGSVFAANLWGHSFNETAPLEQKTDWSVFVNQALIENGESPLPRIKEEPRRLRNADTLLRVGEGCGLHLQEKEIVEESIEARFHIEFAAMAAAWLDHVEPEKREDITRRALELCVGIDTLFYVDFSFIKK